MSYLTEWKDLIYARDPAAWIDKHVRLSELGRPLSLYPHQRELMRLAFDFDVQGRLPWDTILWSCPKKGTKTTTLALLSLWWAVWQEPPNTIILVANDLEQTQARAYASIVKLLKYNPEIDPEAIITQREIKLSNGSEIKSIASEYAGAAGSNHGLVAQDELWGFVSERARRLHEELTPVPTRLNSIRLITTYAGYEAESELLRGLYLQGVDKDEHPDGQGERIHAELPVYANREARLFCYWDHTPRFPWQTPEYYASQRRALRPSAYLRFHENRWSTSNEAFITPELWDACTDDDHRPLLPTREIPLFVGVDASLKHDSSAVVSVGFVERDGVELVALAQHRIWHPSPDDPIDLEEDIEKYLRQLCAQYRVWRILVDPWQLAGTVQRLSKERVHIEPYAQTTGNLTRSGQALFDLLNGRTLLLYRAPDLRQQALQTVAIESTRGWRVAKDRSSQKIDSIVALSMACVGALQDHSPHRFAPLGV